MRTPRRSADRLTAHVRTGILGIAGIVAFWISAPIVLPGLAIMLGLAGRRLAPTEGRGVEATLALTLGITAATAGALMWSLIT